MISGSHEGIVEAIRSREQSETGKEGPGSQTQSIKSATIAFPHPINVDKVFGTQAVKRGLKNAGENAMPSADARIET